MKIRFWQQLFDQLKKTLYFHGRTTGDMTNSKQTKLLDENMGLMSLLDLLVHILVCVKLYSNARFVYQEFSCVQCCCSVQLTCLIGPPNDCMFLWLLSMDFVKNKRQMCWAMSNGSVQKSQSRYATKEEIGLMVCRLRLKLWKVSRVVLTQKILTNSTDFNE